MSKIFQTRIQIKYDSSTNWNKAVNFTPLQGELCFYSDLNLFKIGDGITLINDLDFIPSTSSSATTESNGKIIFKNTITSSQMICTEFLKEEIPYVVNWDGIDYDVTCHRNEDLGLTIFYLGNIGEIGGPSSDYPFLFYQLNASNILVYNGSFPNFECIITDMSHTLLK